MSWATLFRTLRFRVFYACLTRRDVLLEKCGGACSWTVSVQGLGPASHVLCAGAGHDISFEKELIGRFGCRVVLLDPSPTGIQTVEQEKLAPEQLDFRAVGLAGEDGLVGFDAPEDALEGSFSGAREASQGGFTFPCKSVSTLMSDLGWKHIDLLKMDVEGFEYGILYHILEHRLDVRQICLEFHHRRGFSHTRKDTVQAILALRRHDYSLVHHIHSDHTFLRR